MIILERELKRYLILAIVSQNESKGFGMYSSDVDNLWHSFILFTKEYAHFCMQHSDTFLHHVPESDTPKTPEQLQEEAKNFYTFTTKYQEVFKEEVHPIWLLDASEKAHVTT